MLRASNFTNIASLEGEIDKGSDCPAVTAPDEHAKSTFEPASINNTRKKGW